MKKTNLEERVAALEKEVAVLKAASANGSRVKDWRRTVGMFTGDAFMNEVFDEAAKIREADRQHIRKRSTRKSKARV